MKINKNVFIIIIEISKYYIDGISKSIIQYISIIINNTGVKNNEWKPQKLSLISLAMQHFAYEKSMSNNYDNISKTLHK